MNSFTLALTFHILIQAIS